MKEFNLFNDRLRFGSHLGLERITQLCKELGDPQTQFKSIHIAGTNGKGSVSAILSNVLINCGYRIGQFTSPHLIDYRERFQINGQMISEGELAYFSEKAQAAIEKVEREFPEYGPVTEFEAATLVGFLYFAEQNVDCAVIEVGLGGRLDSTNVITPELSIITPISYDHMDRLGDSLAKIAVEKAGIIKAGVPVVSGHQPEEAAKVLRETAANLGADFYDLEQEDWSPLSADARGGQLLFPYFSNDALSISLLGYHQLENAAAALLALKILDKKGWELSVDAIKIGLSTAAWPGRLELISAANPLIIMDGAHNQAGINALATNLPRVLGEQAKITFIIGLSEDRPAQILYPLLPLAKRMIFTKAVAGRLPGKDPSELYHYAISKNILAEVKESIPEALAAINQQDIVCICGSLYLIGEVKAYLSEKREEKVAAY